jgi:predicted RND superfamily exporter protein
LGIAVDDTIHFMSRYLEEFKHGGTHAEVIKRSFREVGTGMMMTTIVLVAGFSSVLTSDTRDHRVFGALGVITLVMALLCDMFLLPAMLAYFDRARAGSEAAPGQTSSEPTVGNPTLEANALEANALDSNAR